jgi:hypothetical protein
MCHIFFEYDVARDVWSCIAGLVKRDTGGNYEQVARLWISNESNGALNIISSAVIWNLWKMRNELHLIWKANMDWFSGNLKENRQAS